MLCTKYETNYDLTHDFCCVFPAWRLTKQLQCRQESRGSLPRSRGLERFIETTQTSFLVTIDLQLQRLCFKIPAFILTSVRMVYQKYSPSETQKNSQVLWPSTFYRTLCTLTDNKTYCCILLHIKQKLFTG